MSPSWLEAALVAYARRFPVQRGKMRVVESLWPLAAGANHRREARLVFGDFVVPADLDEILQRQFYFFGTYFHERHVLECWSDLARTAKVAMDIGANAGIYSLAAAAANRDIQVHAFEPTPEIAERLRRGVQINGLQEAIAVHECAISDHAGTAALRRWRGEGDANEGMNFIVEAHGDDPETVTTISIDEFRKQLGLDFIDLMKMDIQGHEATALRGARKTLEEGAIGTLFLELNWGAHAEAPSSALDCIALLNSAGYRFAEPGPAPRWRVGGPELWPISDIMARRIKV